MLPPLPTNALEFLDWPWEQIAPYYQELAERPLDAGNVAGWLAEWSQLRRLILERYARLSVARDRDTTDPRAEARYNEFLDKIDPAYEAADLRLKERLLASGLEPDGFEIPLRNMRQEAALFRAENLPLLTQERKFETEYYKTIGAQTIAWEGVETPLPQLGPVYLNPDRSVREKAWRLASARRLQDRAALNSLWGRLLGLREGLAANADYADYRGFRWNQLLRFDYGPADAKQFHRAIAQVGVPAAARLYEKHRRRLGLDSLRPWDLKGEQGTLGPVDPPGQKPLRPFVNGAELMSSAARILKSVDAQFGAYFDLMQAGQLLDLDNRKGKAPGGYCMAFPASQRPFIFMNAVGLHNDVQTLLHESGHAFHVFEASGLPYSQQQTVPMEFAEVASMSMELLAAPFLAANRGGFYSDGDAARARVEHLESLILFWPYMAVVDAFQHWVYENPRAAHDPQNCDREWLALWNEFMPGVNWTGLEEACMTGWQRKLHIFAVPFYYVEYGLAQLGAVQVWRNASSDQARAVEAYRRALALGGMVSLPRLYSTAGARFAFDAETLDQAVGLIERTIAELDPEPHT